MPIGVFSRATTKPRQTMRHRKKTYGPKGKAVAKIARTVVNRALAKTIENKTRAVSLDVLNVRGNTIYLYNPFYYIPSGTTEADRIGDRITHSRYRLRGTYYHRGVSLGNSDRYSCSKVRVMVFRAAPQWNSGAEAQWSNTNYGTAVYSPSYLFKNAPTSDILHVAFPNMNHITVLADKVFTASRKTVDVGTSGIGTDISIDIPLGSAQYLDQAASNYLKGTQVYVAIMASSLKDESNIPIDTDYMGYFSARSLMTWRDG